MRLSHIQDDIDNNECGMLRTLYLNLVQTDSICICIYLARTTLIPKDSSRLFNCCISTSPTINISKVENFTALCLLRAQACQTGSPSLFGEADLLFSERCLHGESADHRSLSSILFRPQPSQRPDLRGIGTYEHGVVPLPVLFTFKALTMQVTRYSKQDQADHGNQDGRTSEMCFILHNCFHPSMTHPSPLAFCAPQLMLTKSG